MRRFHLEDNPENYRHAQLGSPLFHAWYSWTRLKLLLVAVAVFTVLGSLLVKWLSDLIAK